MPAGAELQDTIHEKAPGGRRQPDSIDELECMPLIYDLFPRLRGRITYGPICPSCGEHKIIGWKDDNGEFHPMKIGCADGSVVLTTVCTWCQDKRNQAAEERIIRDKTRRLRDYERRQQEENSKKSKRFK